MAFDDLPPQAPLTPEAEAYIEAALRLSRVAAGETRCVLDIAYGEDWWQKLDVYLPPEAGAGDLPVFVNIHGGGWTHGFKEWMGLNAPAIVAFPAVYVSVSYRLAPAYLHPAQFDDCMRALAWVHRHIADHGGDPARIHVGGHSAGGHLSSLMALRSDLHARYSLPDGVIKSCFPYSGIYNLCVAEGAEQTDIALNPILASARDARNASPIAWVSGNRVPFFVTWGEHDFPLCRAEGEAFAAALASEPGRVESRVLAGLDHFSAHLEQRHASNLWTRTLKAWLRGDPAESPIPD